MGGTWVVPGTRAYASGVCCAPSLRNTEKVREVWYFMVLATCGVLSSLTLRPANPQYIRDHNESGVSAHASEHAHAGMAFNSGVNEWNPVCHTWGSTQWNQWGEVQHTSFCNIEPTPEGLEDYWCS